MTVKTTAQQLASDLSGVAGFLREEWEVLSHYERIELIRQAGALPAPDNLKLLAELFERLDSPVFQAQILSAVVISGTGAVVPGFLEAALRNGNSRIRANAVEALAGLQGERLRAAVIPLLNDEDNRVRANACVYLWVYEDVRPQAKSTLETMAVSNDPWTRASAVYAAGQLADVTLEPILVAALDDQYEPAVIAAVRALLIRGYPHLVRRVAGFLADARPSTALWHACADALAKLDGRGPDVEDGLLHALANTGDRELQLPEHRERLGALASGKLALYADLLDRAVKEISRRQKRWWRP
ncbi:MAG: HEAT repeat domain-containing protein [Candidatus Wallbacteria bacterium]|nr:HEAT repeat domain-containing protein [Candidatus Wallbacteria bacterium]